MKTYVLDTNVILDDPLSIFKFKNNLVIIPIQVIEEVDKFKKNMDQIGRNARYFSNLMDELRKQGNLADGVTINDHGCLTVISSIATYLRTVNIDLDFTIMDNQILACALYAKDLTGLETIFITNDTNLRIRSDCLGIKAESYRSESIDVETMYTGVKKIQIKNEDEISSIDCSTFKANEFVEFYIEGELIKTLRFDKKQNSLVELVYSNLEPWGCKAINKEQEYALELLLNDDIKLVSLVGSSGCGKAQPLDADILTPTGYKKMGELNIGDEVVTPSGEYSKILQVFPQGCKEIFEVTFSDGTSTECCDDHLWATKNYLDRGYHRDWRILPLSEIRKQLYTKSSHKNWSIPMVSENINFSGGELPIDSYLLGVLLGDGSISNTRTEFSTSDEFILEKVKGCLISGYEVKKISGNKYDYRIVMNIEQRNYATVKGTYNNYYVEHLNNLGLLGCKSTDKFIPDAYKFTSAENRIKLLQGLMDTDGTVSKNRMSVSFTTTSEKLKEDFKFLIESLGGKCTVTSRFTNYTHKGTKRTGQKAYTIFMSLPPNIIACSLPRKTERIKPRSKYVPTRFIVSVKSVGHKEAQCILIDHPTHLYITNNFIVTHNTLLAIAAALHKTTDDFVYKKVLVSRPVMQLGKDLGFTPGDIMEKMAPYMQPIYDNVEFLMSDYISDGSCSIKKAKSTKKLTAKEKRDMEEKESGSLGQSYKELLAAGIMQVEPMTYIRGRSISQQIFIVDEIQNMSPSEIKCVLTRAGHGCKIILTGDIHQIDSPYLDAVRNGLSYVVEKFKDEAIAGHILLTKCERSELAELAAKLL